MITYKNKILTIQKSVDSADTILTLNTDIEATYLGNITLSNKQKKIISFVKEKTLYKARLLITEEDLPYLSNCFFNLIIVNGYLTTETISVPLTFNILKINQSIKVSSSEDIKDLKVSLAKLDSKLEDITKKLPSFTVSSLITINRGIKPGMIPVAIDETGRCIFQHPFIDHVTEINGQKTVNNAILLTAKDIPIEQTDVESAIKAHTEAIKELNNLMKTVSSELKSTKAKVADIEKALLQHTDSSII